MSRSREQLQTCIMEHYLHILTWWPVPHGVLRFGDPESKILHLLLFRAFENHVGAYVDSSSSTGDELC